ncbi:DNA recombination protein RmuC [Porphyromonas pogonae]|uniref:DNA recombination protein RmuC n=1 Tax=Porphyromonas pogonae TaxID=867595 RepID=UPI002E7A3883|nr:DNA recombination protein RmuC [Porphyromonas pogonae]
METFIIITLIIVLIVAAVVIIGLQRKAALMSQITLEAQRTATDLEHLAGENRALKQQLETLHIDKAHLSTEIASKAERLEEYRAENMELRNKNITQTSIVSAMEAEMKTLRERLQETKEQAKQINEELQLRFKDLAVKILDEKSEALNARSEETLKPLREDLKRFGEQVDKAYSNESRERFSLHKQIMELMAQSTRISEDANNLTRALKGDSKVQGDWGEMILENILRNSGLTEGQEYFVQETLRDSEGNVVLHDETGHKMRPDVIIRYPNGQLVIIDSKVSLTAYSDYVACTTDDDRTRLATAHLASVRRHIDELSRKDYQRYCDEAPEFVMLFIPNEPAYALALQQSPGLWDEAYKKRVVLINPTNLIAALRMAQDLWVRDKQVKNVEEIVKQAADLYDKFCNYAESLLDAERKMQGAMDSIGKAKGQLMEGNGNLVRRLEKLRSMGLSTKKNIPTAILDKSDTDE